MHFKKVLIFSLFTIATVLISSTAFCDLIAFDTKYGNFTIKSETSDGIQNEQTYKFGGKLIGKTEFIEVKAKRISSTSESDLILLKAPTGGSGCVDVVSIVTINRNGVTFSPSLPACGGVEEIYAENNVVTVQVLDRYEETRTVYKVKGDWVSENGLPLENNFSFLDD